MINSIRFNRNGVKWVGRLFWSYVLGRRRDQNQPNNNIQNNNIQNHDANIYNHNFLFERNNELINLRNLDNNLQNNHNGHLQLKISYMGIFLKIVL